MRIEAKGPHTRPNSGTHEMLLASQYEIELSRRLRRSADYRAKARRRAAATAREYREYA